MRQTLQFFTFIFLCFIGLSNIQSQSTITLWTFDGDVLTPEQGMGTASLVGGVSGTFAAGFTGNPDRGWNTSSYPSSGMGNKTSGVQFAVSTVGASGIQFSFNVRHSNTAANTLAVQYSADGGTTFFDAETITFTPAPTGTGDTWFSRSVDLSSITDLDNNPDAIFRVVSAFDSLAGNYLAARSTSSYSGGGTLRFDNVTVSGSGIMRITEFMYSGNNDEFVEFTNVGAYPVDMTGWSYADDNRVPGSFDLSDFGVVAPGESVVLSEISPILFRSAWNLCNNVKVVGPLNVRNLGRNDEINLYDADDNLIDRLTYGDQDFPGSIRTQNISGYVSAAGLGMNDIYEWSLSVLNDLEGSYFSTGGDLGSPGKSTQGIVPFDPCPPTGPQIRITEYMYSGLPGEFVEFTNTGNDPIDMTGWSYDDDSRTPGAFDLSGFGIVLPGESVIITEVDPEQFRQSWNLCRCIKILGPYTNTLGRNDEINLYDSEDNLVDRLTYGDQDFSGTIRTQNISGFPTPAGLGTNNISEWMLSVAGDSEESFMSNDGMIGSPGLTNLVDNPLNPCQPTGILRITEFAYAGNNGEYIELTNIGDEDVVTTGWSYSDDARNPGSFDLSAFGTIQPGQSVIITEADSNAFRTAWNVPGNVKIIGGLNFQNLGRNDEINIYDDQANLVDRLTYGDQAFPGTIRTQNVAGYPSRGGLGSNLIGQWRLAVPGDDEGTYLSSGGDIGSPGISSFGSLGFTNILCCEGLTINCSTVDVTIDGDGQAIIDESMFEGNAMSDCGLNTVFVDSPGFTCEDIGTASVLLTAVDVLGNTASCTAQANVQAGSDLPSEWSANNIGNTTGSSFGSPCDTDEFFTLSANQFTTATNDNQHFVSQTLCGNGSITTKVVSIEGSGFAGVQFRETLSAGSKKATLKTQLSNFVRREARMTTNGVTQSQQIPRPNATWLRIERNGNQFVGYTSNDGNSWQLAFAANILMNQCIEVGVFAEGINANETTVNLQFTEVQGEQNFSRIHSDFIGIDKNFDHHAENIQLFPNPAQGEFSIRIPSLTYADSKMEDKQLFISDAQGRIIKNIAITSHQQAHNITDLQPGVYFIQIPEVGYIERLVKF